MQAVRGALWAARDPAKAEPMRKYMKSAMPFLGVQKPERTKALRPIWRALELCEEIEVREAVSAIWEAAEYREERYAALELLDLPRARKYLDGEAIPLFERLVTEGAWWDLVDACSGPIGAALEHDPEALQLALRCWAGGPDLWLRRSAMIAQLRLKAKTDFFLLVELVETALDSPGLESPLPMRDARFFLHKGAGWALRAYAWTAPDVVATYLETAELPPLTRREAERNLGRVRRRGRLADSSG